jgi:hypothetical protein
MAETAQLPVLTGEIMDREEDAKPLPAEFKRRRSANHAEDITVEHIERYLQVLSDTGLMNQAAAEAGLSYNTILRLRKLDDVFREYHDEAMEQYKESLVREAHRRAVDGWQEPVFSQRLGTQIGTIQRYDSRLLELMLKRHIPEFREKFEGEIKISGGVLVAPIAPVSPTSWAEQDQGNRLQLYSEEKSGMLPAGPGEPAKQLEAPNGTQAPQ